MAGCQVCNNIRTLRFHHNEMTQQALADKLGVTRQTVNAIELAKYAPSLELAFRVARVFDVALEEVFQYVHNGDTRVARQEVAKGGKRERYDFLPGRRSY